MSEVQTSGLGFLSQYMNEYIFKTRFLLSVFSTWFQFTLPCLGLKKEWGVVFCFRVPSVLVAFTSQDRTCFKQEIVYSDLYTYIQHEVQHTVHRRNRTVFWFIQHLSLLYYLEVRSSVVVLIVMSKWIFETNCVITPQENRCDSRPPLGLPRPRCGATSHPHRSPMACRRKNGCRAQLGEWGALYVGLPGTSLFATRGGDES